jgi:hypothetical protein
VIRFVTCVDKVKQIQAEQVVCACGGNFHSLQVKFRDRGREMCVRFQQPSAREWPSTVFRRTVHCTNIELTDGLMLTVVTFTSVAMAPCETGYSIKRNATK